MEKCHCCGKDLERDVSSLFRMNESRQYYFCSLCSFKVYMFIVENYDKIKQETLKSRLEFEKNEEKIKTNNKKLPQYFKSINNILFFDIKNEKLYTKDKGIFVNTNMWRILEINKNDKSETYSTNEIFSDFGITLKVFEEWDGIDHNWLKASLKKYDTLVEITKEEYENNTIIN